ncbi:MAG: hypothetical protein IPK01_00795 [Acidobacteria bacterium]|nr:hypothetical protein [Acidobacteriota bacterium]
MKLLIVPGGGDPESPVYKAGFNLITKEAKNAVSNRYPQCASPDITALPAPLIFSIKEQPLT